MSLNPILRLSGVIDKEKSVAQCGNTQFVCGCPSINLEKIKNSWESYDNKALPGIMSWIETAKPLNEHVFQYCEVLEKLKEHDPPHRYEFTFVKKLLLPELSKRGIRAFPLDLIAILYTLHVPCRECKFLSAKLDSDSMSGLESGDLFLQFQYEDTGEIWSYRVKNFEHPEIASLVVVE